MSHQQLLAYSVKEKGAEGVGTGDSRGRGAELCPLAATGRKSSGPDRVGRRGTMRPVNSIVCPFSCVAPNWLWS